MSQDQTSYTTIKGTIEALESWQERIATTIETLKYFDAQGPAVPNAPPAAGIRSQSNEGIAHDTFFQMTVPDAAAKYLAIVKNTRPTSDIATTLLSGGLKSASKNFTSMIKTVLGRDARFVKVNKEWGLSSWYPGMKRGARTTQIEPGAIPKPVPTLVNNQEKSKSQPLATRPKEASPPESLKTRVLNFLNSRVGEMFSAPEIAKALGGIHAPSVNSALSTLLADKLIKRPQKGRYQGIPTL